jgi:nitrate/TMAO reductase-like tetraheme cytochrome c subunit
MKEHWGEKQIPNPMTEFLAKYKPELQNIQFLEQQKLRGKAKVGEKFVPANACITCHQDQGKKWHKTAHSLAYATLITAQAEQNPQCIKCHSVGHTSPGGFASLAETVLVKKDNDPQSLEAAPKGYWQEIKALAHKIKSVRKLSAKSRMSHNKVWQKVDEKYGVLHNFGNVQCLNCHKKSNDHPFESSEPETKKKRRNEIKSRCLACHDYDQSPEWYSGDHSNAPLNEKVFNQHYKAIQCPKYLQE